MNVSSRFILLSQWAALFLKVSAISFDILNHQVFPGQFIVIRKVVDYSAIYKISGLNSLQSKLDLYIVAAMALTDHLTDGTHFQH